ncbi:hypothetical protein SFMTTN_3210 [Sulfuriferula multivorans]|uniref:Uncharacterized protein n=1 Tax=Sulfuriferula multivorans TaxID=1559896 RepID=A0A401JHB7_9PROT|nr:hypothetical protein SFMTTN_3210 [Sulfuriferula multivorans]
MDTLGLKAKSPPYLKDLRLLGPFADLHLLWLAPDIQSD